ncbi:SET domain-containing protein 5 [Folsomia candida]|uniref:SET domain-containing protein 5 n=1 Tax=Folsomia candida TaxID=158441 RepID=A0A226F2Q2_FOLCA|nr:SET domain-containing protein 5 [Folsomia candida]XP_035715522.1 SET domain-containing protein 5 [Folsomia candida]OXA63451.1 SET domain-containing protein 5 [Folsomia candida]
MSTPPSRHCAYCLVLMLPENVKVCGKCRRRAYCSVECQTSDWSVKGDGQRHRKWCDLNCGEEDLDWKVVPVPGKGLGVIALRQIPAHSRIMVDGWRPNNPLGAKLINDMEPAGGTFLDKVNVNGFRAENPSHVICARLARVNHNCAANAFHLMGAESRVKILFSLKDIEKGEEICIAYSWLDDERFSKDPVPTDGIRRALEKDYGIVCPLDCICRDKEIQTLAKERNQLFERVNDWAASDIEGSPSVLSSVISAVKRLLEISETVPILSMRIVDCLLNGYYAAKMKGDNRTARQFLKRCKTLTELMYHPESEKNTRLVDLD